MQGLAAHREARFIWGSTCGQFAAPGAHHPPKGRFVKNEEDEQSSRAAGLGRDQPRRQGSSLALPPGAPPGARVESVDAEPTLGAEARLARESPRRMRAGAKMAAGFK